MKKRINYILFSAVCCLFTLGSCERDNYDGPNASVSGVIKDAVTSQPVGTDLANGSQIRVYEKSPDFPNPPAQTWVIKPTGEYRNNLVFAATYDIEFINGNFYPFTLSNQVIAAGENKRDFEVTPYIRIKDPSITYDAVNKRVTATFKLEGGKTEVKVGAIRLYAFTDAYVGEQVKFATSGNTNANNTYSRTLTGAAQTIDPTATQTLTIDVAANSGSFGIPRNYYFRIGALAIVPAVGTIRHNYSSVVKIAL